MSAIITLIGTAGFFFGLFLMFFTKHGTKGIQQFDPDFRLPDMTLRYNAAGLYDSFEQIGTGGREAYRNYLLLDFGFILCFLIVMLSATSRFVHNPLLKTALISLAVVRMVLDLIENTMMLILLYNYPVQNPPLASVCSWVTTIKLTAVFLWFIGILAALFIK